MPLERKLLFFEQSAIKLNLLLNGITFVKHCNNELSFVGARYHSSGSSKHKNHYDVLQITPKATKNQIKKSYYQLSMVYHPDQNRGNEEAIIKFREITEAYEVLSDVHKRRLYDKGLFGLGSPFSPEDAEAYSKTANAFKSGKRTVPTSGRTPIYDFDEWSKFHYQGALGRKYQAKVRREHFRRDMELNNDHRKFISLYVIFIGIFTLGFVISNVDEDVSKRK